jgi:hypothetical protein
MAVHTIVLFAASAVVLSLTTAATAQTFLKNQPQRVTVTVVSPAKPM